MLEPVIPERQTGIPYSAPKSTAELAPEFIPQSTAKSAPALAAGLALELTPDSRTAQGLATPMIGTGHVWHGRTRPKPNRFQYGVYFWLLPMVTWGKTQGGPARNRSSWLSFYDCDHGLGDSDALAWAQALLSAEGVPYLGCEIWLQTFPRVLGYTFKPVSFWYVVRPDDTLAAVLAEVNNTFGQRHVYLLAGEDVAWGATLYAQKVFHVSPFCSVEGQYRFRFDKSGGHMGEGSLQAIIDHDPSSAWDGQNALIKTLWHGQLAPYSLAAARQAFWRMPLLTLGIIARIHWQALRLWWRAVPFFKLPPAPKHFVTR